MHEAAGRVAKQGIRVEQQEKATSQDRKSKTKQGKASMKSSNAKQVSAAELARQHHNQYSKAGMPEKNKRKAARLGHTNEA